MDLAAMAEQYRRAAYRAGLVRDWLDEAEGAVREARADVGVIGDNRLSRDVDGSLTAQRSVVQQHGDRMHEFIGQCQWRAGEIDAYLTRRTQAEGQRATHMRAEYEAAAREEREPTDRFAPSVPEPPHSWMRGS